MMNGAHLRYPKGIFTDVRIETVHKTIVQRRDGRLTDVRNRVQQGAFVRVFDGVRWYMSGFTSLEGIQAQMDQLAALASSSHQGRDALRQLTDKMQVTTGQIPLRSDCPVFSIDLVQKQHLVEMLEKALLSASLRQQHELFYTDFYTEKRMMNSLGNDVSYEKQGVGLWGTADYKAGNRNFADRYVYAGTSFEDLMTQSEDLMERVATSELFVKAAEPVSAGTYEVILAPAAAGLFAHESVGHLSEADFTADFKGEAPAKKSCLTVIDDGNLPGWGYTPYDDEGILSKSTVLVEQGQRKQRMHSLDTALRQGAELTGNGRAVDYSFEPMVRMTNTYIKPGGDSLAALKKSVTDGVLIENVGGGFGMATFTLNPIRCWRLKNGQVQGPATAAIVTGQVSEAVANVSMVSNDFEMHAMVKGGCGKMDQFPLDVGFGGPYIKVEALQIW